MARDGKKSARDGHVPFRTDGRTDNGGTMEPSRKRKRRTDGAQKSGTKAAQQMSVSS